MAFVPSAFLCCYWPRSAWQLLQAVGQEPPRQPPLSLPFTPLDGSHNSSLPPIGPLPTPPFCIWQHPSLRDGRAERARGRANAWRTPAALRPEGIFPLGATIGGSVCWISQSCAEYYPISCDSLTEEMRRLWEQEVSGQLQSLTLEGQP